MISRRELIGSGIAVSALGLGPFAPASADPDSPSLRVSRVLVDARFEEARRIARRIAYTTAGSGAEITPLPRDVLELWYSRLLPALQAPLACHVAFAGVTTEHGFFLLRTLAADQRLSVLSSTVHAADAREPLVSWVIGRRS